MTGIYGRALPERFLIITKKDERFLE